MTAKSIPKTLFCVTEMRFSKKIILTNNLCHVILWITKEYVEWIFGEINSKKNMFYVAEM